MWPPRLILSLALGVPLLAEAITPEQVLVVVNERSAISARIADSYRGVHAIPRRQLVTIRTDPLEEIDRETFTQEIEQPLGTHLVRHRLQDQILVIVLTKGVPLKIRGDGGPIGTQASVDSELTLLYRRLVQGPVPPEGQVSNPYFREGDPTPFGRADSDIYLVVRLDGYVWEDVQALLDRAAKPARRGTVVLDLKPALPGSGSAKGNAWLLTAADRLRDSGLEVRLDESAQPVTGATNVIGYAGWGSNDPAFERRSPGFGWLPGALATWFVSTSARSFTKPPARWNIGSWDDPAAYHAGSPQSLVGDLIAEGASGVVGFAYEPYLEGTARPDILFPAYRAGYTLAESAYMAIPHLSWQAVAVGDPLLAPFGPPQIPRPPAPPGISKFLERRALALEAVIARTASPEATSVLVRVLTELAGEMVRAERLDEALASAQRAVSAKADDPAALYVLGAIHLARGERREAEESFKALIRAAPRSPLARRARRQLSH